MTTKEQKIVEEMVENNILEAFRFGSWGSNPLNQSYTLQ